jgi:hypothetical protein
MREWGRQAEEGDSEDSGNFLFPLLFSSMLWLIFLFLAGEWRGYLTGLGGDTFDDSTSKEDGCSETDRDRPNHDDSGGLERGRLEVGLEAFGKFFLGTCECLVEEL